MTDHARASTRLEVECDFAGAAREALLGGEPVRAARLSTLAGDDALCRQAIEAIASQHSVDEGVVAARDLVGRGFHHAAGMLFARLGAHSEAGTAFAAAGDACSAAQSFDLAGRPAEGARALEGAIRRHPNDDAARLALGRLLARHGRTEAALKALQALAPEGPERREALPVMARCLADLGLDAAATALHQEMIRLGVAAVLPESAPLSRPAGLSPKGALILGRYEVAREVAATAHAQVLDAVDRVTGEHVAVKLLAFTLGDSGRDALHRFEREARALTELRHPNVVPIRAYHPERPAIVLAWMTGGSLASLLEAGPMAPARAAEIACAILSALGEAHRVGILHRDIKPSNVLFDGAGVAHVADFGAAHLGDLSSTATAGAIGTFAYMSPEQRQGRPATVASDLYSAGVVLGELLTGVTKGHGTTALDPLPSACHPDLDATHDAVLARMLEEDPEGRPRDAFEARRLISSVRWSPQVKARAPRPMSQARSSGPPSATPRLGAARFGEDSRGALLRRHDSWLGRDVLVLPATEPTLARARAFARAGHAALPTVLRVDEATVWVGVPLGRALADEPTHAISAAQVARLREAVDALHATGGAHGHIDRAHLHALDGEVTLAFPWACAEDNLDDAVARDVAALNELAASSKRAT